MARDNEKKERKKSKRSRSHRDKKRRRRSKHSDSDSSESDHDSGDSGSPRIAEKELKEYMAKKAQKKAQKLAKKMKQNVVSGYTNESNPFGDSNLTENFVWRKKIEKDVMTGVLDPKDISVRAEKQRQLERMEEVEKVKRRREERLAEKAKREDEMALLARERSRAEFQDWEKKEEEFLYEQSKVRSSIRMKEGRAKPIDVMSKNLALSSDFDPEISEPYLIFRGLTVPEMEELRDDIRIHIDMDSQDLTHAEFWKSLIIVCNFEIAEAQKRDALDRARVRGEEPPPEIKAAAAASGLHSSVDADVDAMLEGKSSAELDGMEDRINRRMEAGEAKVVEYWEGVLKRLKIFRAKARLREIHADLLRKHLSMLEEEEEEEEEEQEEKEKEEGEEGAERGGEADAAGGYSPELMEQEEAEREGGEWEEEAKEGEKKEVAEAGSFSPELVHGEGEEEAVDPEQDLQDLERKRALVRAEQQQQRMHHGGGVEAAAREGEGAVVVGGAAAAAVAGAAGGGAVERMGPLLPSVENQALSMQLTAAEQYALNRVMGEGAKGDVAFGSGAEVSLESQVYWWHDKYRPRKPKYFNRVHTGYEWNKYNQTHYDHDNPPPKTVQGYKFNVFYPDLIDKSKAPTYAIERDGSNGETCLLRFHAGPPYEDIAFRIVNREWEYSHKKGFKSTFDRGILHLYFNFKRHRYRR